MGCKVRRSFTFHSFFHPFITSFVRVPDLFLICFFAFPRVRIEGLLGGTSGMSMVFIVFRDLYDYIVVY